jgi:GNAT superfamily N-acetyltransferase
MSRIRLTEPDQRDVPILSELGSQTFVQSYGSALDAAQLSRYVLEAFSEVCIARELLDSDIHYLLAWDHDRACAYSKLMPSPVPESLSRSLCPAQAVELKRLYVIPEYWGQGVGATLMEALLDWASAHHYQSMWLRVWEKNERAIAFYQRWGFRHVGQEPYCVGNCSETVWLMVRP